MSARTRPGGCRPCRRTREALEETLAPWGDQVRTFRSDGFYERFPAKGQIERVARIHRDLAKWAGIEVRAGEGPRVAHFLPRGRGIQGEGRSERWTRSRFEATSNRAFMAPSPQCT